MVQWQQQSQPPASGGQQKFNEEEELRMCVWTLNFSFCLINSNSNNNSINKNNSEASMRQGKNFQTCSWFHHFHISMSLSFVFNSSSCLLSSVRPSVRLPVYYSFYFIWSDLISSSNFLGCNCFGYNDRQTDCVFHNVDAKRQRQTCVLNNMGSW